MMQILETERLILREFTGDDAAFIYELVNDPDWLHFIGDKHVHNLDDAREYIRNVPLAAYQQHGYGLYLVQCKQDGMSAGICGLVNRDTLDHPDIGFAFLPAYRGRGYATEAAAAVLEYAQKVLQLPVILAVTAPDNAASARVLHKIGLRFAKIIRLSEEDTGSRLFIPGNPQKYLQNS